MKAVKRIAIALIVYVGIVAAFESLIGFFQPADQSTLVITTQNDDGAAHDRVLARIDHNGRLYVAANHWPRAWYRQALANPNVQVTLSADAGAGAYVAVPVDDDEYGRVDGENALPLPFRILTGFPPRYFLRLDPPPIL